MPKNKIEKDIKLEKVREDFELSYDTKTLITVLLLVTAYPIGVMMMFVWMKWNKWIKFLVLLPVLLAILIPLFILAIVGSVVMKVGGDLINSGEFREIRRGMMNRYVEEVSPTEMEISPTIKIIPLNR